MPAELGGNFFLGEAGFFNLGFYLAACATTAYALWRHLSLYSCLEAYTCNNAFQKISNLVSYLRNVCIRLREQGLRIF